MSQFSFFGGGGFRLGGSPSNGGARVLADLLARKPSEDDTAEAHLRWGKPSRFVATMRGEKYLPWVNTVNWPTFPNGEGEDQDQPVNDWTEIAGTRVTSDVRVENPDDAEQYVIVQRTESAIFRTSEGKIIRLNFANQDGN